MAKSGRDALFGSIVKQVTGLACQASNGVVLAGSATFLAFHDINGNIAD